MENCDDWSERREEDPGGDYPSAPTPPHERLWRHPSELAANTVREMPTATAIGRGFFIVTGVAVIAFAFGLVRVLSSEPGSSVVAGGASSVDPQPLPTTASLPSPSASVRATPSTTAPPLTTISISVPTSSVPAPPQTLLTSLGTSAIVWADGTWAVTSAGALTVGQSTDVQLPDGESRTATVVAVDDASGLALLALAEPDGTMPPAPEIASLPAAGSTVLAVARNGTSVNATLVAENGQLLVQPDEPAELNDGAPLTDQNGFVVGLCSRSADGRTRALDLSSVRELVKSLPGGWIGVSGRLERGGVAVIDVVAGSPAEAAGLQVGDLIVRLDGHEVSELDRFSRDVRRQLPGSTMVITVQRGDQSFELTVTVGDRLDQQSSTTTSVTTTVAVTTIAPPATTRAPTTTTAPTTATPTTSAVTVPDGSSTSTTPAPPTTTATSRSATAPASAWE